MSENTTPSVPLTPPWLSRARRLAALAQTGLAYTHDAYDAERFEEIRGIAAEMLAEGAGLGNATEPVLDLLTRDTGYATPKVDVRGVVFDSANRLLLVREASDGGWTLPGGWADVNESPAEAVVKEVREEAGRSVHPVKLLAVLDYGRQAMVPLRPVSIYKLFLLCEETGELESGNPLPHTASAQETDAARFFAKEEITALPLSLSRTTSAQIALCFTHHRDPRRFADFD